MFFRLLHYRPTLFIPSFPIVPFRRNALSEAPIQSGDLLGIFFRWSNYIYYLKSFLIFLLIEYIFNHVFISVWTQGYLFYTFGYNPKLCYLFCCSKYSSFGLWELFTGGSFVRPPPLCVRGRRQGVCFKYFLTFWQTRYPKLIRNIPCLHPRISHFSKEIWFLLLEN